MQVSDIVIAGAAVTGAVVMKEAGASPEWVSLALAAVTGSGLAAGFRLLDGKLKGWRAGVLSLIAGAVGGYFFATIVVHTFRLDHTLTIPLTFFASTVLAGLIRSFATQLEFDQTAQAIEDRLNDRIGKR